jgi:hypothetical protein
MSTVHSRWLDGYYYYLIYIYKKNEQGIAALGSCLLKKHDLIYLNEK